jgi:hypothetical protein
MDEKKGEREKIGFTNLNPANPLQPANPDSDKLADYSLKLAA